MKVCHLSFLSLLFLTLLGCDKENVYEGIYKGMLQREEMVHPSNEPIPSEQPTYEEYRKEREETLNKKEEG